MKLTLLRYSDNSESTLGLLFIDGKFECHTLEDEKRTVKVWGETRIPEGTYKIELRKEGRHHERYSKKFPDIHKGMLHLIDVPNFTYVLIHLGNNDDDTAGCLLVGDSVNNNQVTDGFIGPSTPAYKRMYPKVAEAVEKDEVYITIEDLEKNFV